MTHMHEDERFAAWVDACLPPDELRAFEAEMERDPALKARAEAYRTTVHLVQRTLTRVPSGPYRAPEDFVQKVVMATIDERKGRRFLPLMASAAAAAVLLFCYAWFRNLEVARPEVSTARLGHPEREGMGIQTMPDVDQLDGFNKVGPGDFELERREQMRLEEQARALGSSKTGAEVLEQMEGDEVARIGADRGMERVGRPPQVDTFAGKVDQTTVNDAGATIFLVQIPSRSPEDRYRGPADRFPPRDDSSPSALPTEKLPAVHPLSLYFMEPRPPASQRRGQALEGGLPSARAERATHERLVPFPLQSDDQVFLVQGDEEQIAAFTRSLTLRVSLESGRLDVVHQPVVEPLREQMVTFTDAPAATTPEFLFDRLKDLRDAPREQGRLADSEQPQESRRRGSAERSSGSAGPATRRGVVLPTPETGRRAAGEADQQRVQRQVLVILRRPQ